MKRDQLYNELPDSFTHKQAVTLAAELGLSVSPAIVHSWIAVWRFKGELGYRDRKYRKLK